MDATTWVVASTLFLGCAVDVTTILGRCTGQPTKWLKQSKEKSQNKLCKHSRRHPGWGMGEPPCKMGPAWEGKSPKKQPQAHKKGPVGHKMPQNGLRKRSNRQHHMLPGQARG
ncbi:hypothetical protein DFH08DRAFT_826349 [Mycena albidolilacea]|uniref:Secreted protein n=1 Tax=Mycena albidolilacea TaxID=1033008 RepID=A0AAD6Z0P7_9AGAR|nr:hypothetical protein DFH08DRAFT_826349 [Mycena albidolilacea]